MRGRRRLAGIFVRVAATVVFVWLAIRGIRLSAIAGGLGAAAPGWLAAALAALTASFLLASLRWRLLVRGQGVDLSLEDTVRWSWIGLFLANVLPTGFGGDAARAWLAGRRNGALPELAASVVIDRIVAAWALVGLGALAVLLSLSHLPSVAITACMAATLTVCAVSVAVLARTPARLLARVSARSRRLAAAVASLTEALARYRGRPRLLAAAFGISLLSQAAVLLAAYLLARSIGLNPSPALLATTIPVALLATAVPSSINGLGIREVVFRVLLVPAGVPASRAVAFSLLTVAAALVVSLPGAVAWISLRRRGPIEAPPVHARPLPTGA
jgi:glycosyltransferase 2 family protein